MSSDTFANVIQVVATLIALVGLAVSFEFSRRGQKLQQQASADAARQAEESNRAAQAAAQRASAAAALTIDDLTRIADGVERLAAATRASVAGAQAAGAGSGAAPRSAGDPARFESPGLPAAPAWRLERVGGSEYRLTNTGTAPAFDLWVGGAPSLDGPHGVEPGTELPHQASVMFRAAILPTTTDSTITVTWASARGGAERSSWRYPLPEA
ncbi:hypothetical protein [Frondihabitans peucedani]|uniref:Uncharacterized protein n=1 Tax=Frondihabitans peucedani TaxID=598626 RepID=A0ABP8DXK8_9MICO